MSSSEFKKSLLNHATVDEKCTDDINKTTANNNFEATDAEAALEPTSEKISPDTDDHQLNLK